MLAAQLKSIRTELGYTSARSFFLYLNEKGGLEFNYSYYMKIESGQVLPSIKIIHQMCALVPEGLAEKLVLAYCGESFPKHSHLFAAGSELPKKSSPSKNFEGDGRVDAGDLMLSEKQVLAIAESKVHYFVFTILSLARRPLVLEELTAKFGPKELKSAIEDLESVKVLMREGETVRSTYPDWRFPESQNGNLEASYIKMDSYDQERDAFFELQMAKGSEVFRRMSPRFLGLVLQNIEILLQTMRLGDDVDKRQNTEVVALSVKLSHGKIPG